MPENLESTQEPSVLTDFFINNLDATEVEIPTELITRPFPNTYTCHCCHEERELVSSRYVYSQNNVFQRWCADCLATENSFSCSRCRNIFSVHHNDGDDNCLTCADILSEEYDSEDRDDEYRGLADYSARINLAKTKWPGYPAKNERYFGVELEVEVKRGHDFSDKLVATKRLFDDKHFLFKSDGSLTNGFEIVSVPAALGSVKGMWEKFLTAVPEGLRSQKTSTCGMHVHVSRVSISPLQLGKLLVFMNSADNTEFLTQLAGRGPNSYCQRKTKTLLDGKTYTNEDRYEIVNVTMSTIEFRLFRGTLTYNNFMKNVEFCNAICEFCKETSMKNLKVEHFLAWFKHQDRNTYPSLRKFINSPKKKKG